MRRALSSCTAVLCLLLAGCQSHLAGSAQQETFQALARPTAQAVVLGDEAPPREATPPQPKLVVGRHVVVAAEHPAASAIGVEIYRGGGNVVDAAVATAFAVCVSNPSSCGIGGGGFMMIHIARSRQTFALDYREVAPQAATRDMFVRDGHADPELSRSGGLAIAVPGEVAGLAEAQRRFGNLSLAKVMAPAIALARDGVPVGAHLAKTIADNVATLRRSPKLATTYLHEDGSPLQRGEMLRQPQLAATLETISRQGPAAFYRGPIAADIVAAVQSAGGVMTAADLAAYRPLWREPVWLDFRGDVVMAMPPPSSAGVLLEVFGMTAGDDLPAIGHGSVTYDQLLTEAMKHGFADRARLYGDPAQGSEPVPQLISPSNLRDLRARIRIDGVLPFEEYGSRPGTPAEVVDDHGTSHLSVLDDKGNSVACTTTINTAFGSMVVAPATGIVLNNEMDDFSAQPGVPNVYGLVGAEANAVAPGRRPLSSMSPTIVVRDGKAVLAAGGSGGPLILSGTMQAVLNARVFGQDAAAAVGAPRLHHQWMPQVLFLEAGVGDEARQGLEQRGQTVRPLPSAGAIQLVQVRRGRLEGASDARKEGEAAAW